MKNIVVEPVDVVGLKIEEANRSWDKIVARVHKSGLLGAQVTLLSRDPAGAEVQEGAGTLRGLTSYDDAGGVGVVLQEPGQATVVHRRGGPLFIRG